VNGGGECSVVMLNKIETYLESTVLIVYEVIVYHSNEMYTSLEVVYTESYTL